MSKKTVCPVHPWVELNHYPGDDIRTYECPKCGWMTTDEHIKSLTPEKMAIIRKDYESLKKFQSDEPARREAEKIKAQIIKMKLEGKHKEEEAKKWKKKHGDVKSITDYMK